MDTSCLTKRFPLTPNEACELLDIPGHSRDLRPIVHVLMGLAQCMEVTYARIAVVFTRPDLLAVRIRIVDEYMLRSVPPRDNVSGVE